ncbi:hypothetical protein [Streptomyces sp. NPDC051286]|uniref:hypothetical protein n=1 Tax=Streptomyces sp. NPDC051286 TaxID=3365647 RepID=UPI0037AF1670
MGIPAAHGNTYPLSRRCGAPEEGEFADAELLRGVVVAQGVRENWRPVPYHQVHDS